MKMAKSIDEFFSTTREPEALHLLQELALSTGLIEKLKWGIPTFTSDGKNIVGIAAFKSYIGLWFYQGVFLKDKKKKLVNAQEGTTKAMRQWRFQSLAEIKADEKLIVAYIKEAIVNHKAGKAIKPERSTSFEIPELLKEAFNNDLALKSAFEQLTPGKRKEYALYVSGAKREETKANRVAKISPMIKSGVGLNDKYK